MPQRAFVVRADNLLGRRRRDVHRAE
jgi:hypothetical protein